MQAAKSVIYLKNATKGLSCIYALRFLLVTKYSRNPIKSLRNER